MIRRKTYRVSVKVGEILSYIDHFSIFPVEPTRGDRFCIAFFSDGVSYLNHQKSLIIASGYFPNRNISTGWVVRERFGPTYKCGTLN